MHREDEHGEIGTVQAEHLQEIKSVRTIERNIDYYNVGPAGSDFLQCAMGIFGFAANCEIGLLIDHQREALTDNGMIVDDEYTSLLGERSAR
jgi:hypothetical protein